ncbi:MAG: hypothetical protein ACI85U_004299 [Candidatus Promineifilaceae bacterium]|jgi:hypothetical protein
MSLGNNDGKKSNIQSLNQLNQWRFNMDFTPIAYIIYISLSIGITIWVAQTLFKNGRIFVVDAFAGNEAMADAVNHLLLVGFYLVNIGFIALFMRFGTKPENVTQVFEFVATKVGVVLFFLGIAHFFNIFNFSRIRKKSWKTMVQIEEEAKLAAQPVS